MKVVLSVDCERYLVPSLDTAHKLCKLLTTCFTLRYAYGDGLKWRLPEPQKRLHVKVETVDDDQIVIGPEKSDGSDELDGFKAIPAKVLAAVPARRQLTFPS